MSDRRSPRAPDDAANRAPDGAGGGGAGYASDPSRDEVAGGDGASLVTDLEQLGFREQSSTRRGGRQWLLVFNRYLSFTVHDHADGADTVVLTWSCALGDFLDARGWQLSVTDLSTAELYPQRDVRLPADGEAVRGEITRVLASLRIDLGDPAL